MKTLLLPCDSTRFGGAEGQRNIVQAAEILRHGGLVAMPTETVYGLAANALDTNAVARIFEAKQRPLWDPVIVHIAGTVDGNPMLESLVTEVAPRARNLMASFWPGPLTLLLPRSDVVPDAVTAGRPLVGVRMPAHPVAFALIREAGIPVAAPSANVFGHISPTTAEHVLADLDGRIDAILDAGPTQHGVESTVLDPNPSPMVIYRPGAVTAQQIREIAGPVQQFREPVRAQTTPREALPSPGVGLRHYAPRARLVLIEAPLAEISQRMQEVISKLGGERVGVMLPEELAGATTVAMTTRVYLWGRWDAPETLACRLYDGLRWLDLISCAVIVCPLPKNEGIGTAIRDRLRKAAQSL